MATKENVLTVLKLADKKLTKEFVKRGAASTTHIACRWQSGLCEIATVLKKLDSELGKLEPLWLGSDTKKSVSLKVIKNIREPLCGGKLGGKTLVDIYEIAEQTSKLLKGVGRKSFIFHPTASLNSSESIKILNSWGNQLSSIVWGWKKFAKSTEKNSSGVEDLLKKISDKASIEKTIKYLNLMLSERYIEYWDMFRDTTDEKLKLDPQGKECEGMNDALKKCWKFDKIDKIGENAKTEILKILEADNSNALKEIINGDGSCVRYSAEFQTLVNKVVQSIKGITVGEETVNEPDIKTVKGEGQLVKAAQNAAKLLNAKIGDINQKLIEIQEKENALKAREKDLSKAAGAVSEKKPKSIVPVAEALDALDTAKSDYDQAVDGITQTTFDRALKDLINTFKQAIQKVPTEVRVKEFAKDLFIVKKVPKGKEKKDADGNTKYELKEANRLSNALKDAKKVDKLSSDIKIKCIVGFEKIKRESTKKISKHINALVNDLCNPVSYGSINLESHQKELAKKANELNADDFKSAENRTIEEYKALENTYNNFYEKEGVKDFEKRFESLKKVLSKIKDIDGNDNFEFKEQLNKVETNGADSVRKVLKETLEAAKIAKKNALGKADNAVKEAETTVTGLKDNDNTNVKDAVTAAKKAIRAAKTVINKFEGEFDKEDTEDTIAVKDVLIAAAQAAQGAARAASVAAVPPTFEAAQADSGESDDETADTFYE